MNRRDLFRMLSAVPLVGCMFAESAVAATLPSAVRGLDDAKRALGALRIDVPLDAGKDDLTIVVCFRRVWKDNERLKLSDAYEVRDGEWSGNTDYLTLARMLIELAKERGGFVDSPERRGLFAEIDGVALKSMAHPSGLIDKVADAASRSTLHDIS